MLRLDTSDTIVAVATPPGPSLRSIVRLSGPASWRAACSLTAEPDAEKPAKACHMEKVVRLTDPSMRIESRFQYWPEGRSYTGQEVVEIHIDGPRVLADAVAERCGCLGARPAMAGEFSLRAFLAGRIDLTRAEAIAGIFQARTPEQLSIALDQLSGGLGQVIEKLRGRLLDLAAWIEATLDFVEEADVDPVTRHHVAEELRASANELAAVDRQSRERDARSHASRAVLVGRPNAGKSLLFNMLGSGRTQALVSSVAGTTRDYLETTADLGAGFRIDLVDTAGEGEGLGVIDDSAQALGRRERQLADLFLVCVPVDDPAELVDNWIASLPAGTPRLIVRTMADLASGPEATPASQWDEIRVSAMTGVGLTALKDAMRARLIEGMDEGASALAQTRSRAGGSLKRAAEALRNAAATIERGEGDELVAMDLRMAVEALDVVTGRDATEEVLDRIFSRFCIGK